MSFRRSSGIDPFKTDLDNSDAQYEVPISGTAPSPAIDMSSPARAEETPPI
jgi:hypothetical protein